MAQLKEGSVIRKSTGDEVIATEEYVDGKVKTDVPTSAEFTDTITTINGKTGVIAKEDVVALGIPAQDTVYVHPSTHSADIITNGTTNKVFTATEKTKLGTIAEGAEVNTVDSVNAKTGTVVLDADDIDDTATTNKFTTAGDISKLAGVDDNANAYVHPNHSGDVTSVGDGATTIANKAVTLAKMADMATSSLLGRKTAGTGAPEVLSKSEAQTLLNVEDGANNYVHPTGDGNLHVPATSTTNNGKFLKAGATAGSLSWSADNDTITTINGKTGAIAKADITALGIPAQDTTYSTMGTAEGNTGTATDSRVMRADYLKSIIEYRIGQTAPKAHTHIGTEVSYNNTSSGLTATNVQSAIDELSEGGGAAEAIINAYNSAQSLEIWLGSETAYNSVSTKDPLTLYFVI